MRWRSLPEVRGYPDTKDRDRLETGLAHDARPTPRWFCSALGVLLRVGVYLSNRSFWMDEGSLFGNLKGKPILDFSRHLTGDQLAPFGFLIAERALLSVLGSSRYVARLVPLFCGIAALFLFARSGSRCPSSASRAGCAGVVCVLGRPDLLLERAEAVHR